MLVNDDCIYTSWSDIVFVIDWRRQEGNITSYYGSVCEVGQTNGTPERRVDRLLVLWRLSENI